MRKIIIIIVVVLTIALIVKMRDNTSTVDTVEKVETGTPVINEKETFRPDPSSATFTIDNEPVTLSSGRNEKPVSPGSAIVEETVLLDKYAYGDINADGKEDTALLLTRYGGGSGTFIYLAAFVSGPVTYRGSDAVFIGDRIAPQSISISGGIVTVKYLDRKPGEAFAAEPTVATSKQFVYKSGKFEAK